MSQDKGSTLTTSISAQSPETVVETSAIMASSSSSEIDSEAPVTIIVTQTRSTPTTPKTPLSTSTRSTKTPSPSGTPSATPSLFSTHPTTLRSTSRIPTTSSESSTTISALESTAASSAFPLPKAYQGIHFSPLSPEAAGLIAAICALIMAIVTTTAIYLHFRFKLKATLKREQRESKHIQTWQQQHQQRTESAATNTFQTTRPARPYPGAI